MKHSSNHYSPALLLLSFGLLGACSSTQATTLPETIVVESGPPEDIVADGETAFVSSIADGSITKLDLTNEGEASVFVPAANDAYTASWGLRILRKKGWLLSVQNKPYDFNPEHAQAGRVVAFDLATGKRAKTWDLPQQTVGNSVDVDDAGNIYVGDIGPNARIVKIDPSTDDVSVWAKSDDWVDGGFGIGGMVFNGTGFYAAHNNLLWHVGLVDGGEAAEPVSVKIAGNPVIFADGMAWVDGGVVYADNDVLVPGSHGALYRVEFDSATSAKRSTIRDGMTDPSGVAAAEVGDKSYLLVNESQLGFAFGVDQGKPSLPYKINVIAR